MVKCPIGEPETNTNSACGTLPASCSLHNPFNDPGGGESSQMAENHAVPRARVFISCGQRKDSDEVQIARTVADRLRKLGFEPWIAAEEQTLDGVKEHIFKTLADSEYLIFVDFKREKLPRSRWTPGNHTLHRGSLFSHQELAVASYLGVDVLAFQESGIKLEGLLSFVGAEATSFKNRRNLPDKIAKEVRRRIKAVRWSPHWRNEIVLEREPAQHADVETKDRGVFRRFFHIIVRNHHRDRAATNCYVYLENAINLDTSYEIPLRTFELKWEGYRLFYVNIPPAGHRRFDAFCIPHHSPTKLDFSSMFSDWIEVIPRIEGAGRYKLTYLVLSGNFPPARRSFILNLAPMLEATTLD